MRASFSFKALLLRAVGGVSQLVGEIEECGLLAFFRFETAFHQIDDDPVLSVDCDRRGLHRLILPTPSVAVESSVFQVAVAPVLR